MTAGAAEAIAPAGPGAVDDVAAYARELIEAAAALPRGGLHRRVLQPAGVPLTTYFTDRAYADMAAANIASSRIDDAAEGAATVFALDAATLGWAPPPRWAHGYSRHLLNAAFAGAGLRGAHLPALPMWQVFDPVRRIGVQLVARPGGTPPWESGGPLRNLIHWVLPRDTRLCHAGTVGVDGAGILLVGAGGSGKSGTTLAGIAAGLDSAGDDYCLLTMEADGAVAARPVFRMLKQDPGGFRRVFGPDADFGPINWQGKWEIHASFLPRDPFVDRLAIRAIVVPKVAHALRSTIVPLAAPIALRSFMPSNVVQLPDGEAEGVRFTAALCRRLPTFELRLSPDRDDIADTIAGLIRRFN